LCETIVSILTS